MDIEQVVRRMFAQSIIKLANAPEGGSWTITHLEEHDARTVMEFNTSNPLRGYGDDNWIGHENAIKTVQVSITCGMVIGLCTCQRTHHPDNPICPVGKPKP